MIVHDDELATKDARIAELEARVTELQAKLAVHEPPPPPVEEYPKWVNGWIVPDRETEDAFLAGKINVPELPFSAQPHDHKPLLPSVKNQTPPEPEPQPQQELPLLQEPADLPEAEPEPEPPEDLHG